MDFQVILAQDFPLAQQDEPTLSTFWLVRSPKSLGEARPLLNNRYRPIISSKFVRRNIVELVRFVVYTDFIEELCTHRALLIYM